MSKIRGKGWLFLIVHLFKYIKSWAICFFPSFFPTKNTNAIWGNFEGLIYFFLNFYSMNLYTSSLSSLNSGYTFLFLSTNFSFISITWFHNFFVGILSHAFFPKMWIHLWNLWGINFLVSSSDLAASFSLSQISYSSVIFFASIILLFFGFFLSFSFFFLLLLLLFLFLIFFFSLLLFLLFFAISVFFVLTLTTFHTFLGTLSSLSLLFSSQSQDCGKQVIVFPKFYSTSIPQSHQSLFSSYTTGNKYSFLPVTSFNMSLLSRLQ